MSLTPHALPHVVSRIQNALRARHPRVCLPASRAARDLARVLRDAGVVAAIADGDTSGPFVGAAAAGATATRSAIDAAVATHAPPPPLTPDNVARRRIWVDLRFGRDGEPAMRQLKLVSKPSRRVYATVDELRAIAGARRVLGNSLLRSGVPGQITVLRTPYGIVEMQDALRKNVGGEVLCIAS
ncbi:hypothetical protein HK405_000753 [Cladochytrium tenue]|nr:hypothetical protein HK405_000753 [Cladochytrium tenue]